jgi:hypothetical protein
MTALIGGEIMMGSRIGRELEAMTRRESILIVLATRFTDEVAKSFADAVGSVDDPANLSQLHRLAILCKHPDEFGDALPPPVARPRRRR